MNQTESMKRYLKVLTLKRARPKTVQNYTRWIKRFFDYAEFSDSADSLDSDELTVFHAQDFLIWLLDDQEYAVRTYNVAVYALRTFYEGVLQISVSRNQIPHRKPEKVDKPFFKPEEVKILIEECPDPTLKAAIALSFGCGLRISEVVNLRIGDIDKNSQTVCIRNSKGNRTRYVHYPKSVKDIINDYYVKHLVPLYQNKLGRQARPGSEDYLFQLKKPGMKIRNTELTKLFSDYIQAFPFSLPTHTFHSLRHSFATALAQRNVNITVIQKMMGHASMATTAGYIHSELPGSETVPDILVLEGTNEDDD